MTTETRPPRVGVAFAASTSREAPCAPVSTTSSSRCCIIDDLLGPDSEPATLAASQGCRMPSWSAWRSPRSCSAAMASTAGCGSATGLAICSRICPTSPATTSGCEVPAGCWRRSWRNWPTPPPRWRTGCGCWTPPRSPVPPAARRSSARRCAGGLTTAGARATRAGTGASSCMSSPPLTAARFRLVLGQSQAGRAGGRHGPAGPRQPPARPGSHRRQGPCLCRGRPACGRPGGDAGHPDRRDEPARFGSLRPVRQWIESVIDTLKGQLGLEQHGVNAAGCAPGSPSGWWPWPRWSGTTGGWELGASARW